MPVDIAIKFSWLGMIHIILEAVTIIKKIRITIMKTVNELIALILGIFGILGVLWQVSHLHSKVQMSLSELNSSIKAVQQTASARLDFEKYRITNLEIRLNELRFHVEDVENILARHHNFSKRKYSTSSYAEEEPEE